MLTSRFLKSEARHHRTPVCALPPSVCAGEMSITNVFHFTFLAKEKTPPAIVPKTYHEVREGAGEVVGLV